MQRQCACGQHQPGGGECGGCRKKRLTLQRQPAGHAEPVALPTVVHEVLRSPGQPLDHETRSFMEPRFGHDFSQVRIHTGSAACASAESLDATAFTTGRHIVFGSGAYAPHTPDGRRLLTHELAHVVQQKERAASGIPAPEGFAISSPTDRWEREAQEAAQSITSAGSVNFAGRVRASDSENLQKNEVQISATSGLLVQRQPRGTSPKPAATKLQKPQKPAAAERTKEPSCAKIYGRPGTDEPRVLVSDKEAAITRVRENLDSWTPYLLAKIPEIVNELYSREENVNWFAAFAFKVTGEILKLVKEELEPVKILIVALAEAGERMGDKSIEAAKAQMTDQITRKLTQERDGMRDDAELYIKHYFEEARGSNEPGCGGKLQALYLTIENSWPRMTADKLEEAKRLVERIDRQIQIEALRQQLREKFEECMRMELYRPAGVPATQEEAEKEQAEAEDKCRAKTGYAPEAENIPLPQPGSEE